MTAPQPTLSDFLAFAIGPSSTMKIPPINLPTGSPWPGIALGIALSIVNPALQCIAIPQYDAANVQLNTGGFSIYSQCVYYLAADTLLNITPDVQGQEYFAKIRKELNLSGFTSGVVSAAGDDSSNVSIVVQDAAKAFTLKDIANLKTPYGRMYLMLAQSYGPSTFGMT
jgi:hypothetical protein